MTITQAEKILTKARKSMCDDNITDLVFARQMHNSLRDGTYTLIIFSLGFIRFSTSQEWNQLISWGLGLAIFSVAAWMFLQSQQYSKIRELFESASPQSIENLKSHLNQTPLL